MSDSRDITTPDALRALYDAPSALVQRKVLPRLDKHCRAIIGLAPFICLSSSNGAGRADVSPRGDAPGFVQVVDDQTLFIPDRRGNNRLDTLHNILENPNVGLLFIIPGMDETLRVYGKATISRDAALLARSAVRGKTPTLGIRVAVEGAHLHCGKAFKRARLWDPAAQIDRKQLPSLARMALEQVGMTEVSVEDTEKRLDEDYKALY